MLTPLSGTRHAELREKVKRLKEQRTLPPPPRSEEIDAAETRGMSPARRALLRDLLIFHLKLWLDGLKDLVLLPVSVVAAGIDLGLRTRLFYSVLRLGERFDLWLNLFGAAKQAASEKEGLFGASRAGDPTLLGQLEELTGGEREEEAAGARRPDRANQGSELRHAPSSERVAGPRSG